MTEVMIITNSSTLRRYLERCLDYGVDYQTDAGGEQKT